MKSQMAPDILLAIVFVAAVGAIALRRRPEPQAVPATRPVPATVRTDRNRSRPAVTIGTLDGTGREMARPPAPRGQPAITVEQTQHIFHELHPAGRNTLCAVCDSQYEAG
jgi:hypothetical protein